MNLTDLHRRLLADVLTVGGPYPLVLTGGYAVQAHGLVDRLSQDLDVATENPERMENIAATVRTGLVLSLEDVVGTKVRALADRGLARDLIDVRAAADRWSHAELETLGRRHARDTFDLDDLQARLTSIDWIDDAEFAAYGLDEESTAELRRWAQSWADDITERLHELEVDDDI
ncbi:hypothetical protein SBI_05621 [Streptomyces bingchenggensis BCW-1]|uniref:Nucleotidyl transferase AbiEii toxin, Type IV TA system n=1 Tax=Streptomyces bingchenggensis (strain BCW-1) TaxID=749414 RepID=D7CCL0_STRBB|nr:MULTISPECIES: nucleotidyl transferase AbiEii/AbiGii toxin family protein [Streptomyces]ADI08741.1 hypothetical protein SBI_05621 [Streptomyces bingchenggensis BCW-1]